MRLPNTAWYLITRVGCCLEFQPSSPTFYHHHRRHRRHRRHHRTKSYYLKVCEWEYSNFRRVGFFKL